MTLLEAGAVLVFACVDLGMRFRCRRMQHVHRTQSANLSRAGGSETDEDQGCASDPGAAPEAFQVHGVAGPAQEAHVPGCVPAGAAAVQHGGRGGQFRVYPPLFFLSVLGEATCISVSFSTCIHCVLTLLGSFFESASFASLKKTAGSFGGAKFWLCHPLFRTLSPWKTEGRNCNVYWPLLSLRHMSVSGSAFYAGGIFAVVWGSTRAFALEGKEAPSLAALQFRRFQCAWR
jgi:hypothetical protein